jgi:hypothetical protein
MYNLLSKLFYNIKFFFISYKKIQDISKKNLKFVFFSESSAYQKYSLPIINVLSSEFPDQIYYFSLDIEDKIKNKSIKNCYIHNYFLLKFFFKNIKADNMILTLTDLGNHFLKKTDNIKKYIYYFHSPVSTTKNYTPKAFDNYDVILCNGNFQINEIRLRENINNLNKKKLFPTGYFYFDNMKEKINLVSNPNKILIAPSWNYKHKYYIDENFIQLINFLLKKNYQVIFRPHPEHFKRSEKILLDIKRNFLNSKFKFEFDKHHSNIKSIENSQCLITDSSGIAIEYLFFAKRPILYLNELEKIHNTEFFDYKNIETIDEKIKNIFGFIFSKKEFENIDSIITESLINFEKKKKYLDKFINEYYSNFGYSKIFLKKNIKKIFYNII